MVTETFANINNKEQAEIDKLQAEAEFFRAQTRKENLIARQHEMSVEEAQKTHETLMASNSEHRVLDFIGSVSTHSTEQALSTLSRWKRQSKEPIVIRITSPGGQVFEGLALYDYILGLRKAGIHVTTVVFGMAASMSAVLLQAGDKRIVAPNAQVMVHEMEIQFPSAKVSTQEENQKFAKKLNERLIEILASRTKKLTKAEITKRAFKTDWWMSAAEVVDAGLADDIGFGDD